MTSLAMPMAGRRDQNPPIPLSHLAWATWRQHRAALAGVAAVLGGTAIIILVNGLTARANDLGAVCHHVAGCTGQAPRYAPTYANTASTIALALEILPALLGVFLGAPLLARELESGTFRFAWTQECGRWRWLMAKIVPLAVLVTAGSGALSLLTWWYLQPFVDAGLLSGMRSPGFNVRGVDFAAWTLVAFAIGAFTGVIVKRVVPAMFVGLAAWAGLFFATIGLIRPHYEAPLVGSSGSITVNWWIVGQTHAGADVLYQPESRFWPFQFIEAGWLVVLALVLLAATAWYVRRRAA